MPPLTPLRNTTEYFDSRREYVTSGIGVFVLYLVVEFAALVWLLFWLLGRIENVPPGLTQAAWELVPPLLIAYVIISIVALVVVSLVIQKQRGNPLVYGWEEAR